MEANLGGGGGGGVLCMMVVPARTVPLLRLLLGGGGGAVAPHRVGRGHAQVRTVQVGARHRVLGGVRGDL